MDFNGLKGYVNLHLIDGMGRVVLAPERLPAGEKLGLSLNLLTDAESNLPKKIKQVITILLKRNKEA